MRLLGVYLYSVTLSIGAPRSAAPPVAIFLTGFRQRGCPGRQVGVKAMASSQTRKRQGLINERIQGT
jgi:hypothetical protein